MSLKLPTCSAVRFTIGRRESLRKEDDEGEEYSVWLSGTATSAASVATSTEEEVVAGVAVVTVETAASVTLATVVAEAEVVEELHFALQGLSK